MKPNKQYMVQEFWKYDVKNLIYIFLRLLEYSKSLPNLFIIHSPN